MPNESRARRKRLRRVLGLGLLCVVLVLVGSGIASAKKPPKPPPSPPTPVDVGTIYYAQGGALHQVESDGSGASTLPSSIVYWAEPSTYTYGGRWFLQVQELQGAYYPTPPGAAVRAQLELFAVHESGSPAVQLTNGRIDDNTFIEPNQYVGGGIGETSCVMRWTENDTLVSYTAVFTTYDSAGNRVVLDGGIYALGVDPDSLSTHVATEMDGYPLLSLDLNVAGTRVLAQSCDWSPDGSAVVYPNHHDDENPGVWIAWATDGFTTPTFLMDEGTHLRWSPDGTRIVFTNGGIYSIAPEGGSAQLLVEDPEDSRRATNSVSWPCWSPSGTHIAYVFSTFSVRKGTGSNEIRLSSDAGEDHGSLTTGSLPRWRE